MTHFNQNIPIRPLKFFSKNIIAYLLHLGVILSCILPFPLTTLLCMRACANIKDASCGAGCGFGIVLLLIPAFSIAATLFLAANTFSLLSKSMKCYILLSISVLAAIFVFSLFLSSLGNFLYYKYGIDSMQANICALSIYALTTTLFFVLDTLQYIKLKRTKNINPDLH